MNHFNFEKQSINMSNSWILGCSLLSCGMMTYAYLDCLSNLPIIHMKRKYRLQLQEIKKSCDLQDQIKEEERIIAYYWKHYNIVFMLGITGVSFIALKSRFIKN
jgi:hypothetical protein